MNAEVVAGHLVFLSGDLVGEGVGGAQLEFHGGIEGTTITDANGHFLVISNTAYLGEVTITATTQDNRTIDASMIITAPTPTITLNVAYNGNNSVTLSGIATSVEAIQTSITFSGAVDTTLTSPDWSGYYEVTLNANAFGDVYAVATDSWGQTSNVAIVSLVSYAPVIGSVTFDNANPKTNDVLTAQVNASDGNNDAISLTYVWTVGGFVVQTTTTTSLTDSLDLSQPGYGDKGDVIAVTVTPTTNVGSMDIGTPVTIATTIANSSPEIDTSNLAALQSLTMLHDTVMLDVGLTASDADGDALTYIAVVGHGPNHGQAYQGNAGKLEYDPTPGWTVTDTFVVVASDGNADSSSVTIAVTVTNTAPVASAAAFFVEHDQAITAINVNQYLTDADGDPLQTIVGTPAYGVLVPNGDGTYNYNPNAGFTGTDSFTIQANDGVVNSNVASITFTITAYAPLNPDGSYSVLHGHTISNIDFSANDSDANGDPTQIIIESGPTYGTLTPNGDGTYRYDAPLNYVGPDTITVSGNGGSQVVVTINVTDIAPQVYKAVVYAEAYNQTLAGLDLAGTRADSDNDALIIDSVTPATHGSLHLNSSTGLYDYQADDHYVGLDSFSYRFFDGVRYSQTVTFNILVDDDTVDPTSALVQDFPLTASAIGTGRYADSIRQGAILDCWFVAAAVGLAYQGRNPAGIIGQNGNNYTVTFPGQAATTVSDPVATPGVFSAGDPHRVQWSTTGGDGDWLAILEKAAGQFYYNRAGQPANRTPWDYINTANLSWHGIGLLTGAVVRNQGLFGFLPTALSVANTLRTTINANKIAVAVSDRNHDENADGIKAGHVYAVLDVALNGTITLYNPTGDNPDYAVVGDRARNRNPRGPVIHLTSAEFKSAFAEFSSET